jgi:DNA-directed RNA polymerase specialized sigma24 family protein
MSDVAVREGSTHSAEIRLAGAIAAGDREAFVALMRRLNGRLYRTARGIVPDDRAAESAVESAWLMAYRTIGSFRGDTTLAIWLMRIVIGEAHLRLRKDARHMGIDCNEPPVRPRRGETRKRTPASNVSPV